MKEFKKEYKMSEDAKQSICEALGLPINTNDETVIYAYIEGIDNEPRGNIDPRYAKEMNACDFEYSINKDIDTIIKHYKAKHKRLASKQKEDDFQQTM